MLNGTSSKAEDLPPSYHENSGIHQQTLTFSDENHCPPRALSIVHDWKEIANKLFEPVNDQEIIETKCQHWEVRNWSNITSRALSPPFTVGDHRWILVLFPRGNRWGQSIKHMSLYLGWNGKLSDPRAHACVQFALVLSNKQYPTNYLVKWTDHRYDPMDEDHEDWGYTDMTSIDSLSEMNEATNRPPLMEEEQIRISVIIRVLRSPADNEQHYPLNEKQQYILGCVPIRNEKQKENDDGHISVVLQDLYSIWNFRRAILRTPASNRDGIVVALQKLFYRMQISTTRVDSQLFTVAKFGKQHDTDDPLEFQEELQDCLTKEHPSIKEKYDEIFGIRYKHSDKLEYFVEIESIHTENRLENNLFNMLIEKGDLFSIVPPVLRFHIHSSSPLSNETDALSSSPTLAASHHRCLIYPPVINVSHFVSQYHRSRTPASDDLYVLQSVIVRKKSHTVSGQYFIYTKRSTGIGNNNQWFKIDTKSVISVNEKQVLFFENSDYCSPYMLTYVQKSRLHEISKDISLEDIPRNIAQWVYDDWQGKNIPIHHRVTLLIFTDDAFMESSEMDIFDSNCPVVTKFVFNKSSTSVSKLFSALGQEFFLPENAFRLWTIGKRKNAAVRPKLLINDTDHPKVLGKYLEAHHENIYQSVNSTTQQEQCEYHFYLEAPITQGLWNTTVNVLVFIKYFDIKTQTMSNLSHLVVCKNEKIGSIIDKVNAMVGNRSNTPLEFYEAYSLDRRLNIISNHNIIRCHNSDTFYDAMFENGDILCAQQVLSDSQKQRMRKLSLNPQSYYVSVGLMKSNE
ncbi:ICP0-binding domain of ubiquitin-specific protease 7-domain-containing protein [Phascolomyces articulosus]|uniref:ICP0-binding domain of ubiquitin-specific protease 7-domain-containing protein n=1 Tax=Phascolomyces articulosus TaxID=60185 RepID=A0AAD5PFI8_9FUNG|nr:ICP0-binding domain of ubiquitin-specific protease 7-domain-containing protein [Phascolomyces articulosus]